MPVCEGDRCHRKQRGIERDYSRNLCDRCHQRQLQHDPNNDRDGSSEGDVSGDISQRPIAAGHDAQMMVNELLSYCMYHQKNSSTDSIKRLILDFYTPQEIKYAKKDLWEVYGPEVLGETPARNDSHNRAAHKKEADDILEAVGIIDTGVEAAHQISFVAANLGRLPRVAPEELDLT